MIDIEVLNLTLQSVKGKFMSKNSLLTPLLAASTGVFAIWYLCMRTATRSPKKFIHRKALTAEKPIVYNLENPDLPRLSGFPLRFFNRLIRSKFGHWFLIDYIVSQSKLDSLRGLVLIDEPTYMPNPSHFEGPIATSEEPHDGIQWESLILAPHGDEDQFQYPSIADYYHAYRSKTTTPAEVAEWVLTSIEESERLDPKLCAVTQSHAALVREMAKESSQRFKDGAPLSFLDGIPVVIKEEICCAQYLTRMGTSFYADKPEEKDCTIVAKLRAAGAIIIGMSNMHELGMGTTGINSNLTQGTARNPHNLHHITGGSSSGSAAAVAAGLVPVAIGCDGGGSVRIPSALCGDVGLKPTFGRISFGGNEVSCHSVVHAGPICTNVRDTALVYALLAGPDEADSFSLHQPRVTLNALAKPDILKGLKVGVYREYNQHVDREVAEVCDKAISYLQEQGAEVVDIEIPELEETRVAHVLTILSEMAAGSQEQFLTKGHMLMPESQSLFETMNSITAMDFITAQKQRTRSIHFIKEIFEKVDVIVTPATARTAARIHPGDTTSGMTNLGLTFKLIRYMFLGNFTGVPGLVVPIGYDSSALPIGLQIMGRWWEDDVVLSVGQEVEKFLGCKKNPQVFYRNDLVLKVL